MTPASYRSGQPCRARIDGADRVVEFDRAINRSFAEVRVGRRKRVVAAADLRPVVAEADRWAGLHEGGGL